MRSEPISGVGSLVGVRVPECGGLKVLVELGMGLGELEGAGLVQSGNAFMVGDQERSAAVAEGVADLEGVIQVIEGSDDEPHPEAGEVARDGFDGIGQQDGHAIPFLEPEGCQA